MNYEDAFKHYQEGTASQEERDYVLDELAKAKALSSLMDDERLAITPAPISEADAADIKLAKKQFKAKYIATALLSACAVLLSIGAILGGVFGSAASYAKKQVVYGKDECTELAKTYLTEFLNDDVMGAPLFTVSRDDLAIDDVDSDFHFEASIKESFYSYAVELKFNDEEYKVNVDTRNGKLIKISRD